MEYQIYNYNPETDTLKELDFNQDSANFATSLETLTYLLEVLKRDGIFIKQKEEITIHNHELLMIQYLAAWNGVFTSIREDCKGKIPDGVVSLINEWGFDENYYFIELKTAGLDHGYKPVNYENVKTKLRKKLIDAQEKFEERDIPNKMQMVMIDLYCFENNMNEESVINALYDIKQSNPEILNNIIIRVLDLKTKKLLFQVNCHL